MTSNKWKYDDSEFHEVISVQEMLDSLSTLVNHSQKTITGKRLIRNQRKTFPRKQNMYALLIQLDISVPLIV